MTSSEIVMAGKLVMYIDGAAQGNPGPAGIGVVICDANNNVLDNISEYIGQNTNNQAEYTALIFALQEGLIRKAPSLIINTDSELLVKQLNGQYKVKDEKIKSLFLQVQSLLKGFDQLDVIHIDRSKNKGADKLATKAINDKGACKTKIPARFSLRKQKTDFL